LEPVGYKSSLDLFNSLGFHSGFRELELGQWPLVICLTVFARTSTTETVHVSKHLLIAQIPFHHKNRKSSPKFEWRLSPTSEQLKKNKELLLSHVYLTFATTASRPHNPPSFRLWMAARDGNKRHRRYLLAGTIVSYEEQVVAKSLLLYPAPHMETELRFDIRPCDTMQMHQSSVSYIQVGYDNYRQVWEVPSHSTDPSPAGVAELIALTAALESRDEDIKPSSNAEAHDTEGATPIKLEIEAETTRCEQNTQVGDTSSIPAVPVGLPPPASPDPTPEVDSKEPVKIEALIEEDPTKEEVNEDEEYLQSPAQGTDEPIVEDDV
jgi:hypothetical protein